MSKFKNWTSRFYTRVLESSATYDLYGFHTSLGAGREHG